MMLFTLRDLLSVMYFCINSKTALYKNTPIQEYSKLTKSSNNLQYCGFNMAHINDFQLLVFSKHNLMVNPICM